MSLAIREALAPVIDWYQSDEHPGRNTVDIVRDVVSDLQEDRAASLLLTKIVLAARKHAGDEAHRIMPHIWPLIAEADKLPSMPPRREVMLRKNGYFYRPGAKGYTSRAFEAGRFPRDKAEAHVANTEGVSIVEIESMEPK